MSHKNQSISTANPLEKENEVWAICYLNNDEDTENRCILTQQELLIYRNAKEFRIQTSDLISISIGRSKHLFFVILGGILAPLSLLGIYENILSTNLLLILSVLALGLFYHGITGSEAVILKSGKFEEIIPLEKAYSSLADFVGFVQMVLPQLHRNPNTILFYARKISENPSEYQLFAPEAIDKDDIKHGIIVDFLKLTNSVYVKHGEQKSGLFISKINKESILKQG